jgi:hypothetical protein
LSPPCIMTMGMPYATTTAATATPACISVW